MLAGRGPSAETTDASPTLRVGDRSVRLGDEAVIVPSGSLLLVLPLGTSTVRFDGALRHTIGDDPPVLPLEMARSVGYHRLDARGRTYWFGTEDAKLALDGVAQMLGYLNDYELGTAWSGQIMFSDGQLLRDPHVVYGWLQNHADQLIGRAAEIARSPLWGVEQKLVLSRRGGPGVVAQATHRSLRTNAARYLEVHPEGMLKVGKLAYSPVRVVRRHRSATTATLAHRRLRVVLETIDRLAAEVQRANADPAAQLMCRTWQVGVNKVLASTFVRALPRSGGSEILAMLTCKEEVVDARYRCVQQTAASLLRRFGWNVSREPADRYSHVQYSDQIYQAFVGCLLADALGCDPTDVTIGRAAGADFASDEFALYLDREPPGRLLRTWRSHSDVPDRLRPDIVVEHRPDRRVLVVDAKYRSAANEATEDSRREMLSYMAAYGLRTAVLAYPPSDVGASRPRIIEGAGQRLIELPIAPRHDLQSQMGDYMQLVLEYLSWGSY